MLSVNHTSTPVVRLALLREQVKRHKKILYITDISEDIFMMQNFAKEITGEYWKHISCLGEFLDTREKDAGYFFLSIDILQHTGNLVHLERSTGMDIQRGTHIDEHVFIEKLISLGYTHGDGTDTPGTYQKTGGTLTIRDALFTRRIACEWFDTELDSIILYEDARREHVANIRINTVPSIIKLQKSEKLNPVILDLLGGTIDNHPMIIVSGCDFLADKSSLLELADIHMGGFAHPGGISVEGGIPDIPSLTELRTLLEQEANIHIYTRYPRTMEDFLEYHSITGIGLHEISSTRFSSGMWRDITIDPSSDSRDISTQAGFQYIISDDILGQIFVKKRSKKSLAKHLDLLLSLSPGDFVVHREHGIALFHTITRKKVGELEREYIELHYRDGDKLFVPLTEIYRISKYLGENSPELTRLSGNEWERTLEKTDEEIEAIAQDIIETSAKRALAKGRAFGIFREEEQKFQDAFSYEYTLDQKTAIEEIFADMESENPMDRLVSGDVGFGKTEVAMNAIYKAVLSGTQVAVLSPLLVLADEHFETFCARLTPFGVRVGILTRMSTPREVEHTLESIQNGTLDVVVGTHRLISDDVVWKRLGLLIIDEEHKFGVTHKEKIKKIKSGLDILALSATPIPRSLNLALSGLKKISLLTTPPKQKKPIETIVTKWNEGTIAQAVQKELERGGQIIIIHNRIRGMESIASEIEEIIQDSKLKIQNNKEEYKEGKIDENSNIGIHREKKMQAQDGNGKMKHGFLPMQEGQKRECSIIITHGQMPPEQIEDRIHAFKKKEYDILLTTTIIENGVNFLSANTIIIIDPEEFGLASLHQLRGRVGRRDIEGVCYLVYRKVELVTHEKERLITIANNTHLGAGFEIAMRDMEIRGAGDVLGIKQAGKSKDIGLTLYFRMLEEKITELKEAKKARVWTKIELELSYLIEDSFFASEGDKLSFYREIENIETLEELDDIEEEFLGKWQLLKTQSTENQNISNLFLLLRARIVLSEYGVTKLSKVGINYVFDMRDTIDVREVRNFLERFDRKKIFVLLSPKKIRVETRYYRGIGDFLRELV